MNAAIYLLSSRKDFLFTCLKSFHDNWNHQFQYPVFIHYFDNIYDDQNFRNQFKQISEKISFHKIEYRIPNHIKEKDLFFNRSYLEYVSSGRFTKERLGYLHMQEFCTSLHEFGNINGPVKELEKFDYLCRIDDDLYFKKQLKYDIFETAVGVPITSGSKWNVKKREIKKNKNHGNIETREHLFNFVKDYVKKNELEIADPRLEEAISSNDEMKMHLLPWSRGLFVYDMKFYRTNQFKDYIDAVFDFGGNYKHRWGDIEILCLYNYIFFGKDINYLDLDKKKIYDPKFISAYAPNVQNR